MPYILHNNSSFLTKNYILIVSCFFCIFKTDNKFCMITLRSTFYSVFSGVPGAKRPAPLKNKFIIARPRRKARSGGGSKQTEAAAKALFCGSSVFEFVIIPRRLPLLRELQRFRCFQLSPQLQASLFLLPSFRSWQSFCFQPFCQPSCFQPSFPLLSFQRLFPRQPFFPPGKGPGLQRSARTAK